MKKVIIWSSVSIVAIALVLTTIFYIIPYSKALSSYNSVVSNIKIENEKLDSAISNAQKSLETTEKPLYENTIEDLNVAITEGQKIKIIIPDKAWNTKDLIKQTETLSAPFSYTDIIATIEEKRKTFEDSIKQLKQVTNPSEEFVTKRLAEVESVVGVKAATEDNDPNGELHKDGGYTSAIYFESSLVNQKELYADSNDIVKKGTDCGGQVEVYATVEDANERNDYLSAFDGGFLSPGKHTVIGTCVVRVSSKLNASQQKELEKNVINVLIELR